jgi:hypothetical protein
VDVASADTDHLHLDQHFVPSQLWDWQVFHPKIMHAV